MRIEFVLSYAGGCCILASAELVRQGDIWGASNIFWIGVLFLALRLSWGRIAPQGGAGRAG